MHARFGAQITVGPLARYAQGDALDARLVARLQIQNLSLVATAGRPAHVHPLQHLGPVLRFGAAGAGIDAHDGALPVVGAGEHAGELHLAHSVLDTRQHTCRLGSRGLVLGFVGQFHQNPRVLEGAHLHVESVHGFLETRLFTQQRLGLLVGVPEVGVRRLAIKLGYAGTFAVDVKDAPGESPDGVPTFRCGRAEGRFPWWAS